MPGPDRSAGRFSVQAWALKAKLGQASELRTRMPGRPFEVHPELSFAALNAGTPVAAGKKTWNGQMTRRALLAAAVRLPADLAAAGTVPVTTSWTRPPPPGRRPGLSAVRPSACRTRQYDEAGQPIAIWY